MIPERFNLSIDEACRRRFEASWLSQPPPLPIEQCLPLISSQHYLGTLVELVYREMEFQWTQHTQSELRLEDYLHRFPTLDQPEIVWELLQHETNLRIRYQSAPTLNELTVRFPQWSERFVDLLQRCSAAVEPAHADPETKSMQFELATTSTLSWQGSPTNPELLITKDQDASDDDSLTDQEKRYFGEYQLLRKIASGGMGVVFLARQLHLNRTVAIKFIRAGQFADEREVKRFLREAEHTAQLSHPNIVPIFDFGELNGNPYYSMAYIEGSSLQEIVSKRRLAAREAAEVVCTIAQAVAYAHDLGIIHRDLKPANVLIDNKGRPVVTDFGLARKSDSTSSLTETGQVMGTPAYMAPEQARGDNENVGPHTDQYSLGVMLYELLTGQRPFDGPVHLVLPKVIRDEPKLPSEICSDVPRDLEAICLKAMQKHPIQRYASVGEMIKDLQSYLTGNPTTARPYGRRERTWRLIRQHWQNLSIAVGLLVAVGLTWWLTASFSSVETLVPDDKENMLSAEKVVDTSRLLFQSQQNLTSIGLALHNYHDVYKRFPPWAITDEQGRPLLSWRVAILRYLGHDALYRKFHLNEPWNSPHNLSLIEYMPEVFRVVGNSSVEPHTTFYRAFVGTGATFDSDLTTSIGFKDMKDGPLNTLIVAEAASSVPWTKPDEINIQLDKSLTELGGIFSEGFNGLMADGSVKFLRSSITQEIPAIKSLIGRADGDVVNLSKYEGFPKPERVDQPEAATLKWVEQQKRQTDENNLLIQRRSRFTQSSNNLRQLQLAIRDYETIHRRLPAASISSSTGQPLLSWRVAILPQLQQTPLYQRFKLDEPWDSPTNIQLLPLMPNLFRLSDDSKDLTTTYYQVLVGPETPFSSDSSKRVRSADVTDGLAQTLCVVEAGTAVPWTKPQDVEINFDQPIPKLGGIFEEGFHAVMFDGAVRSFLRSIEQDAPTLKAMIGHRDGQLFRFAPHQKWFSDLPELQSQVDSRIKGATDAARVAALRVRSSNNMRQLAMAMFQYHDTYRNLPAPALCDDAGKPLLSWRVMLLPFLGHSVLFKAFRTDEPWDSDHNRALLQYMPETFAAPGMNDLDEPLTFYQVINGPGAVFDARPQHQGKLVGTRLSDIRDGTKHTLLLVEAKTAVPWTKPEDIPYDPQGALPELGGIFSEGFHACLADGLVQFFLNQPSSQDQAWRSLIEIADGRAVDIKQLNNPLPNQ